MSTDIKVATTKVIYVTPEAHIHWVKLGRLVRRGLVRSASAAVNAALAAWIEAYEAEHGEIQ